MNPIAVTTLRAPSLAASLEAEAARARMLRGSDRRSDLSAREQRYAVELSKRTPWPPSEVFGFLRRMRSEHRPRARQVLEACAAANLDPDVVIAVLRGPSVRPIEPSEADVTLMDFVRAVEASIARSDR